jgi:hypothetical protein
MRRATKEYNVPTRRMVRDDADLSVPKLASQCGEHLRRGIEPRVPYPLSVRVLAQTILKAAPDTPLAKKAIAIAAELGVVVES